MTNNTFSLVTKDLLRETLKSALWHTFRDAGYSDEESAKLAELAIGPVHQSLELANASYKLHIEAIRNLTAVGLQPRKV